MAKNNKEFVTLLGSIVNNDQIPEKDKALKLISKIKLQYSSVEIPKDILEEQERDIVELTLQKYDIIKFNADTTPAPHYYIIYKVSKEFNIAYAVCITSDITLPNIIPIKESRMFKTFYVAEFTPIYLNRGNPVCYKFCGVIDNKKEFNEVCKAIKKYYKTLFRYQHEKCKTN